MSTDPSYTQDAADRRAARFANFRQQAREGSNVQASNEPPPNAGRYFTGGTGSQTDNNSQRTGGELALLAVCALIGVVVAGIYQLIATAVRACVTAYRAHRARTARDRAEFDKQH